MTKSIPCSNCKTLLKLYWLKDGICNACRKPHLIVESVSKTDELLNSLIFFYDPGFDPNGEE